MKEQTRETTGERPAAKPKEKNGFSRRHETPTAHQERQQNREAKVAAKLEAAKARTAEAARRTPEEKLARLDERLGRGLGAEKERGRLNAKIDARLIAEATA